MLEAAVAVGPEAAVEAELVPLRPAAYGLSNITSNKR